MYRNKYGRLFVSADYLPAVFQPYVVISCYIDAAEIDKQDYVFGNYLFLLV